MKKALWGFITLISLATIVFTAWLLLFKDRTKWQIFIEPTTKFSIEYPARATLDSLNEQDKKDKIVFRLTETKNEAPMLVTVRYETGVSKPAALTRQEPLQMLASNAKKALPVRFPEFFTISEEFTKVNDLATWQITFTYNKPSEDKAKQKFLIVMKSDGDTAIYLAAQTKETDWEQLNTKYFQHIFESLKVN